MKIGESCGLRWDVCLSFCDCSISHPAEEKSDFVTIWNIYMKKIPSDF